MIGVCTDSNAQLPTALAERLGIEIVPLTITIDGIDHLEGFDLDIDDFYARYTPTHRPSVSTAAPSSGQFAAAYEDLIARGCTEIVSVHLTSSVSATIQGARLAAHSTPVPVRVVDSGTAGFGIGCVAWAAADAVVAGGSLDGVVAAAERAVPTVGNLFVVGHPEYLRAPGQPCGLSPVGGMAVLRFHQGEVDVVGRAGSTFEAVTTMANAAIHWGTRVRVAIGHSDAASEPLADALEQSVSEAATVVDVVRYRIGPSIGVHTGPGTVGCLMYPVS